MMVVCVSEPLMGRMSSANLKGVIFGKSDFPVHTFSNSLFLVS